MAKRKRVVKKKSAAAEDFPSDGEMPEGVRVQDRMGSGEEGSQKRRRYDCALSLCQDRSLLSLTSCS